MSFFRYFKVGAALLIIVFAGSCCKKGGGTEPDFPVYSYTTTIVNPPSHFQVNYIVSIAGPKTADITFKENTVWKVSKLGDVRVLYSINNGSDILTISSFDVIGFEGGKQYQFSANNSNNLDITNFLVDIVETGDDYETFEKKF